MQSTKNIETVFYITFLYVVIGMFVNVLQYSSENLSIWDLGVSAEAVYFLGHATPLQLFYTIFYKGATFLFYPFHPDIIFMMIAQVVVMASAIPIIYLLTHEITGRYSIFPVLLYFAYPLAWGIIYFPFHYQTLFIPFFLLLYYAKVRDKKLASIPLTILASFVRFPYTYLVTIFAIIEFLKKSERNDTLKVILITSLVFSAVSTALSFQGAFPSPLNNAHIEYGSNYYLGFHLSNLLTVLLMYVPVSFLPFLSYFGLNLVLPTFLILSTNYLGYQYPASLGTQYASLYLPFVIISVIKTLNFIDYRIRKYMGILAIVMFLSFSVVSPISVYSSFLYNDLAYVGQGNQANVIAGLIPANATVLAQQNIAQLYPRPGEYCPLSIGVIKINYDESSFARNFFVTQCGNTTIDYVVVDTGSGYYQFSYKTANMFLENGYGIWAVYGYFYVLKYNYHGKPVLYEPEFYMITGAHELGLGPAVYHANTTVNFDGVNTTTVTITQFGIYNIIAYSPTLLAPSI